MRIAGLFVCALVLAACAQPLAPRAKHETDPEKVALQLDPEHRKRLLEERFPGVDDLDGIEIVAWPNARSGPCWSDLTPLTETPVRVRATEGLLRREYEADGVTGLVEAGWEPIYRTPEGEGLERRASFHSVDLELGTRLHCLCAPGDRTLEGDAVPARLRLRWKAGEMPALSVSVERDGRRVGITPTFVAGRILHYEFPVTGAFPDGRAGRCGATIGVTILVDPAIG